jgi:hypothetical protein
MTSQLNVDTIVDKAGSGGTNVKVGNTSTYVADGGSATQNLVQGLAKGWFHYDGSGTTFADSFNGNRLFGGSGDGTPGINTSNFNVQMYEHNTQADSTHILSAMHGDLA